SVPIALLLTYGLGTLHVQLVFDRTPMMARCWTGFGFLLAGSVALLDALADSGPEPTRIRVHMVLKLVLSATSLFLLGFASIFGNVLSLQDRYNRVIALEIFTAFQAAREADASIRFAAIDGPIMQPEADALVYRIYPVMRALVPVYGDFNGWFW